MDSDSLAWARKVRSIPTRADSTIRDTFLSDKNLASLLKAFRRFGREVCKMTDDEIYNLRFGKNDPITQAVYAVAQSEAARTLIPSPQHLIKLNQEAFKNGHRNLTTDLSYYRRWEEFLMYGANPAMVEAPRPDRYRAEMLLSKKPLFGLGATFANPWESVFGGAVDDFSQMWDLVSKKRSDTAGTEDYRVRILSD